MTKIERRANKKSFCYDKKYSEDGTLRDMLSRPHSFVEGAIEGIVNLLRQKAYRDGYIEGAEESAKELREKLTDAKEIIRKLIADAPNTYSGKNAELRMKKMFSFSDAVNKAEQFLKEIEE